MYTIYNNESWLEQARELLSFIDTTPGVSVPGLGIFLPKLISTNEQFEELLTELGAMASDVDEGEKERSVKVVFGPHAIQFFVKRDEAA